MEKKCSVCKELKLITDFYTDKRSYDGLKCACKKCHAKQQKPRDHKIAYLKYEKGKRDRVKKAKSLKAWREKNKEHIKSYDENTKSHRNAQKRHRKKVDPIYKLRELLRSRVVAVAKSKKYTKDKSFLEYIGCSSEELRTHLESQFQPGMTWENHGFRGWHVDHIIPLASAKSIEELYKLCHYTNLQPLWAKDNISKGAKMPRA